MLEMLILFVMTVEETQNYAVIATRVYILTVQCTIDIAWFMENYINLPHCSLLVVKVKLLITVS